MTEKILIINPFGIGDVLFSTPLVSALKRSYHGCYIAYICNSRTKDMLETNPDVAETFVFERDEYRALWNKKKIECIKKFFNFWQRIRRKRFDRVFDLSLGKEYAFLCWMVGIKERRGFDYRGRGRFLTHRIPFYGFNDKPVAEYYMDLVSDKGQAICDKGTVLLPTDDDKAHIRDFLKKSGIKTEDVLIGVAPGGGYSFGAGNIERRRWGAERFSQLADRIVEKFNARIILIWGPVEKDLVEKIAGLMNEKPLIAPKTSIREMAALCKRCRMVICSEGGPLHVAASQGVKTLSIFGAVDEKVYGPYPPGRDNLVIASDVECRPCYKRFKLPKCDKRICLEGVSVNTVFNAVTKYLSEGL
ncbi:MAG: glycosyltransferase family 9 protein [Candidatus Omnitrophica bacterium]|nr:glycosyltransferase family 9 protein [Candidatus Omnitrophota bacterium]